jgi:hypothetical protein
MYQRVECRRVLYQRPNRRIIRTVQHRGPYAGAVEALESGRVHVGGYDVRAFCACREGAGSSDAATGRCDEYVFSLKSSHKHPELPTEYRD